jgi:hypothetical protein
VQNRVGTLLLLLLLLLNYFKSKLHPSQHVFIKYKSTVTNLITYLNKVTPVVCSQEQMEAIYFDLSQAFDKVPHTLLLYKLNNFGLSSRYVTWFQSYLCSINSSFCILGTFPSFFSVFSGVPLGSTLGPLLFNICINDICTKIHYSNFLLFADDLKLNHVIKSAEDWKSLQADIHSVKEISLENCMN